MFKKIIISTGFVIGFFIGYLFYTIENFEIKEDIKIEIMNGSTTASVSKLIGQIFGDSFFEKKQIYFISKIFFKLTNTKIYPGFYKFTTNDSFYSSLFKIKTHKNEPCVIRIIEGWILNSALDELKKSNCIIGRYDGSLKEGEIFPDTYFFGYNTDINYALKIMKEKMNKELHNSFKNNKNDRIKNKEQLLTFASIVEAEANSDSSRIGVSSVLTNRLRVGMRLQSDPTATYQNCLENGTLTNECIFKRKVYYKDIEKKGDYNTYRIYSLPIAPICLPGKKSIEAAANPVNNEYFYFITDLNGNFHYSKTLKDHINKKNSLQKNGNML